MRYVGLVLTLAKDCLFDVDQGLFVLTRTEDCFFLHGPRTVCLTRTEDGWFDAGGGRLV